MTVAKVLRKAKANQEWRIVICDTAKLKFTPNPTVNKIIANGLFEYKGNRKDIPTALLHKQHIESVCNMHEKIALIKIKM